MNTWILFIIINLSAMMAIAECKSFKPRSYSCDLLVRSEENPDIRFSEKIQGLSSNDDDDDMIEHGYFRRNLQSLGELFVRIDFSEAYCMPGIPTLLVELSYPSGVRFSSQTRFIGSEGLVKLSLSPLSQQNISLHMKCVDESKM